MPGAFPFFWRNDMRRPINPVIPYPHEAIQHTRCVLALSMITVAISFLKPETLALLGDLGKQVEKVNRWIDRCADDTQKRRLSAGAKRDLDTRFHILAGHVGELTATDLKTLKEHLSTMGTRGTTVRRRLCVLRTVLRWCEANSLIPAVPSFPPLPSANYEKFIPPTQEEVSRIFTCAAPHIQRVIVLGTQCGVRIGPSELLKIKWSDVDLNRSVIHVPAAKKNIHEPWRDVPIKSELLPVFEEWLRHDAACGAEYLIHYKGRHVEHIKMAWRGALRRAGITRRIRPYDLRHAFATEAIAAGVDIGTVAKLMGHSSPMMLLKHYQHVMDSQKRAAIEALPRAEYVAKNMWQKRTHSDKDT